MSDPPLGRAFVWSNGKATPLWPDFFLGHDASAISDRGQVVGSVDYNEGQHAVLWTLKR